MTKLITPNDDPDDDGRLLGLYSDDARPAILDSVIDQEGTRWISFGTANEASWFSPTELVLNEKEVFARLTKTGTNMLTSKSKGAFRRTVEEHRGYRSALVAVRPGWLEKAHYVYGNGDVESPSDDTREVIITFEPNEKFSPVGTLKNWQTEIGRAVRNQPIPLFMVMYAFVGAILKYAPSHVQNPQAELVGEGESAKTTILTVAASVHAGDPSSDVGGANTWDMTANTHDPLKRAHADSLFALDEVNLAGLDSKDQREVLQKAGFKAATNGSRKRMTDTVEAPNVRVASLSTSNVPQRNLLKAPTAVVEAFASRIVTIAIPEGHKFGIFRSVPEGFADARSAAEHLRAVVDLHYGVAGRAFIRKLVVEADHDPDELRREVECLMNEFHNAARQEAVEKGKARGEKTVALTYAAGMLAQRWGIIPNGWGALLPATLAVYHSLAVAGDAPYAPSAVERVRGFRARNRSNIGRARALRRPYGETEFLQKAGVLRRNGNRIELLVPAKRFQQEFPDHQRMLKQLRDEGRAQTEGGKQPKNTIKVPGRICRSMPRVYCVTVVDDVTVGRKSRK